MGLVPAAPRPACAGRFAPTRGWASFLAGLGEVLAERVPEAGTPPALDLVEAATLYQTLYWVARTAAVPTPPTDVLHVTAAGWAAIPAIVHKALHQTPMVLTEHGVYVREAYLAAARNGDSPGSRFAATRLARGLARTAYAVADVVSPVTDANAHWELGLGIDPGKILVLYNGLQPADRPDPAAGDPDGRVGRPPRPAQGRAHDAAGGGPDDGASAGRAVPALRAGAARRGDLRTLVRGAARAARPR